MVPALTEMPRQAFFNLRVMEHNLNPHCQELLEQYRNLRPVYERLEKIAMGAINQVLKEQGFTVNSIEHRIKTEKSLAGKMVLKGGKYKSIKDITDIFGVRIITFYSTEVDKVAALAKGIFDIDWKESVDKRKLHELTSFGYNSLHFICRLPKTLVDDPEMPELNEIPFELQMRTALEHVWSTIEHDIGYKGAVKMPVEYRRQFSRLSGMLELIDDEFSRLRTTMTDYRRRMQSLVASGQLDEVPLNADTFRSYLNAKPFEKLNQRIAESNQAEIYPYPLMSFLPVLEHFGMETLGDIHRFIDANAESAYQLALSQLAFTDIDILSESVGLQNLCIVHTLKAGNGLEGVKFVFNTINGEQTENDAMARIVFEQASALPFMQINSDL